MNGATIIGEAPNILPNKDISFNKAFKSERNLSPKIIGSVAFLLPSNISGEFITVCFESIVTLLTEFKFMILLEDNRIESFLELNNSLPEFKIICSLSNLSAFIGFSSHELYPLLPLGLDRSIGIDCVDVI